MQLMRIMHIAPEMAPLLKAGGLGDVVGALARGMVEEGHFVEVVIPAYRPLFERVRHTITHAIPLKWKAAHGEEMASVHFAEIDGLSLRLIEIHGRWSPFDRHMIYGEIDDLARFIAFSRAAAAFLESQKEPLDIVHLHDWTTALVAPLFHDIKQANSALAKTKVALTLHNLEMQGIAKPEDLMVEGIDGMRYMSYDRLLDPYLEGRLNILKGGIQYADLLIAVSPTFAKELLTPEGGCGLHEILNHHKAKIVGILNGIDDKLWNPETDPLLPIHYQALDSIEKITQAKQAARDKLSERVGLKKNGGPLIVAISRLTRQKAPEFILRGLYATLDRGGQMLILGATREPYFLALFEKAARDLSQNPNGAIVLGLDEDLAHLAYAAADAILIPSLYEPCGLAQLIGMRYGTIPLARCTGGLKDTLIDGERGYLFDYPTPESIDWVIERFFKERILSPEKIQKNLKNCIEYKQNFKMQVAAYLEAYRSIL